MKPRPEFIQIGPNYVNIDAIANVFFDKQTAGITLRVLTKEGAHEIGVFNAEAVAKLRSFLDQFIVERIEDAGSRRTRQQG